MTRYQIPREETKNSINLTTKLVNRSMGFYDRHIYIYHCYFQLHIVAIQHTSIWIHNFFLNITNKLFGLFFSILIAYFTYLQNNFVTWDRIIWKFFQLWCTKVAIKRQEVCYTMRVPTAKLLFVIVFVKDILESEKWRTFQMLKRYSARATYCECAPQGEVYAVKVKRHKAWSRGPLSWIPGMWFTLCQFRLYIS